jgi:eukaryotic-like serine/threonine-protein kinase
MSVGELRPPPAEDFLLGKVISDRYRVLRKLGEGGMGAVYLAEHVFIQKKVALKVLAPELAQRQDLAARFLQEARAASRIGQENVIDISDFGQTPQGLVFFAMEYLEGADLGATVRTCGALSWPRTKGIVLQICKALRAAHRQGIVHRDMKPENIFLIEKEGRADFVKLLDFGIAKVMGNLGAEGPRLTRTGMIFGTPEYMAPEQADGKPADHRVDIYAVGCVIYHCLTGATPFQADSVMGMLTKHLLEDPVPPSARRPDLALPSELDALVLRALEKDRERRWQSMDELMTAVQACEGAAAGAAAADPTTGSAPRPTVTKAIGGSGAGIPAARNAAQKSSTETMSRDEPTDVIEDVRARRNLEGRASRLILVVAGLALGVAVGVVVWSVSSRDEPRTSPAALRAPEAQAPTRLPSPDPPATAAEVVPPPPVPSTSPTEGEAPASIDEAAAPASRRRPSPERSAVSSKKAGYRRIKAPEEPAPAPPKSAAPTPKPASTPIELKPFPQQ